MINRLFETFKSKLIVSCQAENGFPLDSPQGVLLLAQTVLLGGASAIRSCGLEKVKLLKESIEVPVIGLTKSKFQDGTVRITGSFKEVDSLVQIHTDIIAVDGTHRLREGLSGPDFIREIKKRYPQQLIMADISTFQEAVDCKQAGADCVSTTLSGYTPHTADLAHDTPNYELLKELVDEMPGYPVIAEGRFNTPQDAAKAIALGAWSVVVGTAITRPHMITSWFADAIAAARPKIIFGTDGWRAKLGEEINVETVSLVAQAFADYVIKHAGANLKVAIGYDSRDQSDTFAATFAQILAQNQISVYVSDSITPTPFLSFATKTYDCFAGVMITASHNPAQDNGIKFKTSIGRPFTTEATKEVEALLGSHSIPVNRNWESSIYLKDFREIYYPYLDTQIDFEAIRKAGLKLMVDSMGGSGQQLLKEILKAHGIIADCIFGSPLKDFGGRSPEPIEKNLLPLQQALSQGKYSFGVASDGDADRMGVCLDTAEWLSAQETIMLLVDYMKRVRQSPGGVVKTSSVTDKVRLIAQKYGAKVYEVQVGFKYIADVMEEHPIAFGGEESGGFGYGIHIPERDGIFSALILLEMLAKSGHKTLSAYLAERRLEWGEVYYDRIDYTYSKPDKNELLPILFQKAPEKVGAYAVTEMQAFNSSRGIVNGLKFILEGDCRWVLVRSSETEQTIRFYAEGQSIAEARDFLQLAIDLVINTNSK